ncbi:MAG TPA: hypothetical protein VGJ00_01890 [Rhabdochlamydiaceae bacterium]|jgi:hypothetical protein
MSNPVRFSYLQPIQQNPMPPPPPQLPRTSRYQSLDSSSIPPPSFSIPPFAQELPPSDSHQRLYSSSSSSSLQNDFVTDFITPDLVIRQICDQALNRAQSASEQLASSQVKAIVNFSDELDSFKKIVKTYGMGKEYRHQTALIEKEMEHYKRSEPITLSEGSWIT